MSLEENRQNDLQNNQSQKILDFKNKILQADLKALKMGLDAVG